MSILFKLLNALTTENQSGNTPLTFTAKADSSIVLEKSAGLQNEIYFKLNDNEWQSYDHTFINLASGDVLQFENKLNEFSHDSSLFYIFQITGEVYASGNLLSLINYSTDVPNYAFINLFKECTGLYQAPMIPATSVGSYAFYNTFSGCSNLQNCPDLPAMEIADYCYSGMFFNCTSLTKIPKSLPATTLAQNCYDAMFKMCESLTEMPILPATTLADYCYNQMFYRCSNLQFPTPSLPATDINHASYQQMFIGCSSLIHSPEIFAETADIKALYAMFSDCSSLERIHVHFTVWPASNATNMWVSGVKSSGTFVKPTDLPEQFGVTKIPSSWTIENF